MKFENATFDHLCGGPSHCIMFVKKGDVFFMCAWYASCDILSFLNLKFYYLPLGSGCARSIPLYFFYTLLICI